MTTYATLTPDELVEITGYRQPHRQVEELHRQGYWRARRAPITGRVIVERVHYEAVARGVDAEPAGEPRPGLCPA